MEKTYLIKISKTWSFRFKGQIPAWKRAVIHWLVGWKISEIEEKKMSL